MITVKIRARGGAREYTGVTLAAVIREQFGPDATINQPQHRNAGERVITVPRADDRVVVGSVLGRAARSAS